MATKNEEAIADPEAELLSLVSERVKLVKSIFSQEERRIDIEQPVPSPVFESVDELQKYHIKRTRKLGAITKQRRKAEANLKYIDGRIFKLIPIPEVWLKVGGYAVCWWKRDFEKDRVIKIINVKATDMELPRIWSLKSSGPRFWYDAFLNRLV